MRACQRLQAAYAPGADYVPSSSSHRSNALAGLLTIWCPLVAIQSCSSALARVVFRGRPHAGPVRAAIGAGTDQIQGLHALAELGREVMLEQHDGGPVPAGELGPDEPGGLGDGGA